jgi:hypothetical protein
MPKEHIYDPTPRGVNVETGEVMPERLRRVTVAWARDTHVQVGIGWVPDRMPEDGEQAPDMGGALGWSGDFIISTETDERLRRWSSEWCELDRRTINDLIRVLRRARDQAFGRDE